MNLALEKRTELRRTRGGGKKEGTPAVSLSIKSVFAMLTLPRGSAHEIAFAAQMHENRGRVPRFSYFQREKVSAQELSDVRVLRSQNTDCRKNEVFRQSQKDEPNGSSFGGCQKSIIIIFTLRAAARIK